MGGVRMPMITARGSAYEVGCQIGVAAGDTIRAMHGRMRELYGSSWAGLLQASVPFLAATEQHLPRVVQELRGAAEGARVPFDDLFLMSIEELLYEEVRGQAPANGPEEPAPVKERAKGCSDLAAGPPATADEHVWLAHNNDLAPGAKDELYVTRIQSEDEPEIMAVTVGGIFISIGFNSAGIGLTGNQLYANDSRVGVPRLLIVRDILAQEDFESALQAATLPARASSYNNLVSSAEGRIVNVEGSATDCDLLWAEEGVTVHTNHYRSDKMKRFEASDYYPAASDARCSRAAHYAETYRGRIGRGVCEEFLSDHVFAPWSVCRHGGDSVTVFGATIDLTERRMWLAQGNPCQNPYQSYALA